MTDNICPFCGADKAEDYGLGSMVYRCGTSNYVQSWSCKKISKLQAELASAREFIEEVVQIGRLMKNA